MVKRGRKPGYTGGGSAPVYDPRKSKFIQGIMAHGQPKRAALDAGVSSASAHSLGSKWMKDPWVKDAIDQARRRAMEKAEYNADRAMAEANDAIEFAIMTENANAYVKAVELRSKLMGLLVDKVDLRQAVGFTVQIVGLRPQVQAPDISLPSSPYQITQPVKDVPPFPTPQTVTPLESNEEEDPFN